MRFGLAIPLLLAVPAAATMAEQTTLRGSKPKKVKPVEVETAVKKAARNRPGKIEAAGEVGRRRKKPRKDDEAIGENMAQTEAATQLNVEDLGLDTDKPGKKGKPMPMQKKDTDKATYRAQKKAEREAKMAEKEAQREAEKAEKMAMKAEREAVRAEKIAEKEAERAKREEEKLAEKVKEERAGKDAKEHHKEEKDALKKRLDAVDNNTTLHNTTIIEEVVTEDGWMPTPSPIAEMTPFPTEPPMLALCPDKYDPDRAEPYKAGDEVEVDSNIFVCQSGDFEKYCSIDELDNNHPKKEKHVEKLWVEAWKYVGPCESTVDESVEIDAVEDATEVEDEVAEVDDATEDIVTDEVVNEVTEASNGTESAVLDNASDVDIEVGEDPEGEIENQQDEGEITVGADGAMDIDSIIQPQSAPGLEQHSWGMGFDMAQDQDPCVSDVCNHKLSDTCLLKYQINVLEPRNTITMELICEGVTWLGVGFSTDGQMVGSDAVVGILGQGVQKYHLGGRWPGGITPLPESQQTLMDASINVYRGPITVLQFTKFMDEQDELKITPGVNTFLWAQGQSYYFGQHAHDSRGSFQLELPYIGGPSTDSATTVTPTTVAPIPPCTQEWCREDLSPECQLKYRVNYQVGEPNTITMDLSCEGNNWIGLGFSEDGNMVGSEAVIAAVGQDPMKYSLFAKWEGGVEPMPMNKQTLIDTSVKEKWTEGPNGWMPILKMRFTKIMKEDGEIEIKPGQNTFLFAQGQTVNFPSYHITRDSFTLTLPSPPDESVSGPATTVSPSSRQMTVTELSPECTLKHAADAVSITVELTCEGETWLGVGFSNDGLMTKSFAVIGKPGSIPEKYFLQRRNEDRIHRLPEYMQTLTDASITVTEEGNTVMKFTKLLSEPDEIEITEQIYFLYAQGYDHRFGWHGPNSRGSFQLSLM